MANDRHRRGFVLVVAAALNVSASSVLAQTPIPAQFRGDWVAQTATCQSPVRFRVAETTMTLVNAQDSQTWGDVALPSGYFGPDYNGISVVAIADFEGSQPFTVFFNADEKKGIARVDIYTEMGRSPNPAVAKLQAAAKALATRFPLNGLPLKKC
jgi:hypothetical protein